VAAPTIHAGFGYSAKSEGNPIRLEIFNVGALPIKLTHHMKICQLIFEEVHGTPNKGYQGKFSIQGVQDKHS
jgi:deoxycytidine triphosphate deaminase